MSRIRETFRRAEHPLPDVLTIAVCGVLVGADAFEEITLWAQEREIWLQRYLSLPNGIPSHDTLARLFGLTGRTHGLRLSGKVHR